MSSNGAGSRGGSSAVPSGGMLQQKVIDSPSWDVRMKRCEVAKGELNELVMNYLVVEGYRDAAEHFVEESGTDAKVDLTTIEERVAIRKAMMQGNVVEAMKLANDLDPTMLDRDRELRFGLLKQRLLELVRRGDADEALSFAAEHLAPEGAQDPAILRQIEEAVTLLAFEDATSSPLSGLLDMEQRHAAAGRLNAAVLQSQQQETGPWLPDLLRQLVYTQNALSERVEFPRIEGIGGTKEGVGGTRSTGDGSAEGPR
ncbi:unnamed protein product [Ectocarpus sp. CCAP 1310/34]|nr:unnamed protein product [Ectocarpus sp. CCAP 1310/34]